MVSQLKTDSAIAPKRKILVRHPLLQTVEGTVQVFTSPHRSFLTNVIVQALRVAEQGQPVLIVQFLKGGINQGANAPVQLGQSLDWVRANMPHCIHGPEISAEAQDAVHQLWSYANEVIQQGRYSLVVLDELSLAISYGLIAVEAVIELLRQRPPQVDVVLTGPKMPEVILDLADQVTEFRRNFIP